MAIVFRFQKSTLLKAQLIKSKTEEYISSKECNGFVWIIIKLEQKLLLWKKIFFKILFIFRERGRKKEEERNIDTDWLPLPHAPTGDQPATQACALTRNWLWDDPHSTESHTGEGWCDFLKIYEKKPPFVTCHKMKNSNNLERDSCCLCK